MVRPNSRAPHVEAKLDTLVDQLARLSLVMKKSQKQLVHARPNYDLFQSVGRADQDFACSFCQKAGHSANRCPENPKKDYKYEICVKMVYGVKTFCARSRPNTEVVNISL